MSDIWPECPPAMPEDADAAFLVFLLADYMVSQTPAIAASYDSELDMICSKCRLVHVRLLKPKVSPDKRFASIFLPHQCLQELPFPIFFSPFSSLKVSIRTAGLVVQQWKESSLLHLAPIIVFTPGSQTFWAMTPKMTYWFWWPSFSP